MSKKILLNSVTKSNLETQSTRLARLFAAWTITTYCGLLSAQIEVPTGLTPVGVFTTLATEAAFTTEAGSSMRFIESGGGFLWDDGTGTGGPAIGFDHFLAVPPNTDRAGDAEAYFSQSGIPIFADPDGGTFEFTRWAIDPPSEDPPKPMETVKIFGFLFNDGEPADINDDGEFTVADEISLSGFGFSDEPVGRDLIPSFTFDLFDDVTDPLVDHVEFVDTDWHSELVNDTAEFLVAQGVITIAQADEISPQFVPEPTAGCLAWCAVLFGWCCRGRRR